MKKRLLTILMVTVLTLASSITALAAPTGSGTGDDGPAPTQHIIGGPAAAKTGWVLYLVDWNGNQVSESQVFYQTQAPDCNVFYPKTRFGGSINYNDYEIGTDWGFGPFNSDQTGNGSRLKSWMVQKTGDTYNVLLEIEKYFGAAAAEAFKNEECLLICEGLYWCQMYRDDIGATGLYLCAPAYGWADMQTRIGVGEYGSKAIGKYTNNIFPNCVKLESTLYLNGGN